MENNNMCCVGQIEVSLAVSIQIPPNDRPYWVRMGEDNAGPHLTDEELDEHKLSFFKKYKFDEVWAESKRLGKIRKKRGKIKNRSNI